MHAYAWDAENRLVAVAPADAPVAGDKRLDFKYDYRGRRVEKVYSTYDDVGDVWVAQATYRFVYDGWNVVMVLDDNNSTLRKYTWGLDLSRDHDPSRDREGVEGIHGAGGIGGLLAVEETAEQGAPAYWFLYDANGNVGQAIKASDQSIAAHCEYDPYGSVIYSTSTYADDNPIRFSTKWFDTELAGAGVNGAVGTSGLGYWGYRYYSPRLGRWISRDPRAELVTLRLAGNLREVRSPTLVVPLTLLPANRMADTREPNLHGFVLNSPTAYLDPLGLLSICPPGATDSSAVVCDGNGNMIVNWDESPGDGGCQDSMFFAHVLQHIDDIETQWGPICANQPYGAQICFDDVYENMLYECPAKRAEYELLLEWSENGVNCDCVFGETGDSLQELEALMALCEQFYNLS